MANSFGVTLQPQFFFDRKVVIDATDAATRKTLAKVGGFIRQRAARSMRRRKKSSPAGQPPSAHAPGRTGMKLIVYQYQPAEQSVIVGPVKFGGQSEALRLSEHGGRSRPRKHRRGSTVATYPARPFMRPALEHEAPRTPKVYAEQLSRTPKRKPRRST